MRGRPSWPTPTVTTLPHLTPLNPRRTKAHDRRRRSQGARAGLLARPHRGRAAARAACPTPAFACATPRASGSRASAAISRSTTSRASARPPPAARPTPPGFSPPCAISGDGVLVAAFIQGATLDAAGVRDRLERIVALVAALHAEMPRRVRGPPTMFWVFHVIRDYFDTLAAGGHAVRGRGRLGLRAAVDALEAAQIPMPIVFGHHDLLPANFIDDGARLWLIDWEYAGFGTPHVRSRQSRRQCGLLRRGGARACSTLYFRRAPDAALARAFAAMKVASALRETLWAFVSELHLAAPGVDYAAYAADLPRPIRAALGSLSRRTPDERAPRSRNRRHRRRHRRLLDRLSPRARPQGRRDRCWSRTSSPPARPGTRRGWSGSCARPPRSPRCCAIRSSSMTGWRPRPASRPAGR